jgi:hypothetical protein
MSLSPADRAFLCTVYPHHLVGVAEETLDDILDRWFAHDHYADNPVYTWTDNESADR